MLLGVVIGLSSLPRLLRLVDHAAGTHLKLEVSDGGDEAHPEWRTMEMTFLPPLPALVCQHPQADRLGCRDNHPPGKPVTWDAWLQMAPFERSDTLQTFYRQAGVRPGDLRFTIVRQDKAFTWDSVFFKDKDTLVVEVSSGVAPHLERQHPALAAFVATVHRCVRS